MGVSRAVLGSAVRATVVIATVFALLLSPLPAPVAATSGIHLVEGPADAAGCHSLEVWNNDQLLLTIPADDGYYPNIPWITCAVNEQSAFLPNGRLVFDWIVVKYDLYYGNPPVTELWATDGTVGGTQRVALLGGGGCGRIPWEVVGRSAFASSMCRFNAAIEATRGTPESTFVLRGHPSVLIGADPAPRLFVAVGKRILYVGSNAKKGQELWVSNGTRIGTHLLKDIRVGSASSNIQDLVSDGRIATFTANAGTGRKRWVSDGTLLGTHRYRSTP